MAALTCIATSCAAPGWSSPWARSTVAKAPVTEKKPTVETIGEPVETARFVAAEPPRPRAAPLSAVDHNRAIAARLRTRSTIPTRAAEGRIATTAFQQDGTAAPLAADELPAPGPEIIPLRVNDPSLTDRIQIVKQEDRISLTVRDAPIDAVLAMVAEQHGLNVIASSEVNQRISVSLTNVALEDALDAILAINGCVWTRRENIVVVTPIAPRGAMAAGAPSGAGAAGGAVGPGAGSAPAVGGAVGAVGGVGGGGGFAGGMRVSPSLQGRRVEVFTLDYVSATDADRIVKGLLSPAGQSFINQSSPTDQRRFEEQLVVEDLPEYLARVADYLSQVDRPPRQVQVEANVLEVTLKDNCYHGVNFDQLARIAGATINLQTAGMANPNNTPASFLKVGGGDLTSLIEALKSTTKTKTLASPKLTVVDGQQAQLQIGAKLGFRTLQTTTTATLQNVQFLDTGVILKVTPIITQDEQIFLQVKPQVSDGQIDASSGLPNSNTTEVDTRVVLSDGEGLVLGGLIRESDNEINHRLPYVGDLKYVGWLFQRKSIQRTRTEIVITLVVRLVPDAPGCRERDCASLERTRTRLFHGPLQRMERRQWEPDFYKGAAAYEGLEPSTPYDARLEPIESNESVGRIDTSAPSVLEGFDPPPAKPRPPAPRYDIPAPLDFEASANP